MFPTPGMCFADAVRGSARSAPAPVAIIPFKRKATLQCQNPSVFRIKAYRASVESRDQEGPTATTHLLSINSLPSGCQVGCWIVPAAARSRKSLDVMKKRKEYMLGKVCGFFAPRNAWPQPLSPSSLGLSLRTTMSLATYVRSLAATLPV